MMIDQIFLKMNLKPPKTPFNTMKIITMSAIFSLGIISTTMFNSISILSHPLYFSPILLLFVGYGSYKISFKNKSSFKRFVLRNFIKAKWFFNNVNDKIKTNPANEEILPIQLKSIKLWKLLLKDDESQISCSLINKIRQIEKDNMLLILSPVNQIDYQLTIMDVDGNKSCLYEIPIYSKSSEILIDMFDKENQRRMDLGQSDKRDSIHNDLDKLISQQQESLKRKFIK